MNPLQILLTEIPAQNQSKHTKKNKESIKSKELYLKWAFRFVWDRKMMVPMGEKKTKYGMNFRVEARWLIKVKKILDLLFRALLLSPSLLHSASPPAVAGRLLLSLRTIERDFLVEFSLNWLGFNINDAFSSFYNEATVIHFSYLLDWDKKLIIKMEIDSKSYF